MHMGIKGQHSASTRVLKPCGTLAAYSRGCRCEACVEAMRAYHRARYVASPRQLRPCGTVAAYVRGCRCDKCREAKTASQRKYASRSKERYERWVAANPERRREHQRRYVQSDKGRLAKRADNARRRGAPFDHMAREYSEVLLRDPCAYCGDPGGHIDHIVPLVLGGNSEWANLTSACESCNASKSNRPLLAHLARRELSYG